MFSRDDYKDLAHYMKNRAADLYKEEKANAPAAALNIQTIIPGAATVASTEKTPSDELTAASRQLEVLKYDPMMVEALLEEYEVPFNVIEVPLDDLPLHMNDDGIITTIICKWRFERGI